MSKRGFDESQLRKTVVTMIDKDGFNKRSVFEGPASIGSGLPTPTQDGNALISLNGEWIQQPGYGYSTTELTETLGEFTANDFVEVDDGNGGIDGYYATIPLTEELTSHLSDLFIAGKEFNVEINDKIYNSKKDKFTYENGMLPAISLFTDPSDVNTTVFSLYVANKTPQVLEFWLPEKPSNSRIYMEETTYHGIDANFTKDAALCIDLVDTNKGDGNGDPSYTVSATFDDVDAAVENGKPIFVKLDMYYNPTSVAKMIIPVFVYTLNDSSKSDRAHQLTALFPAPFSMDGSSAIENDFELFLEFYNTRDFVLINFFKRARTTRESIFTNQV